MAGLNDATPTSDTIGAAIARTDDVRVTATPPPLTTLSITPVVAGDEAWLRVAGAVDLVTATQFSDALRAVERDRPAIVVLDLRDVNFFDSSDVHLLVAANRRARLLGRRFVVARPSYPVRRVLSITRLDRQIELLP